MVSLQCIQRHTWGWRGIDEHSSILKHHQCCKITVCCGSQGPLCWELGSQGYHIGKPESFFFFYFNRWGFMGGSLVNWELSSQKGLRNFSFNPVMSPRGLLQKKQICFLPRCLSSLCLPHPVDFTEHTFSPAILGPFPEPALWCWDLLSPKLWAPLTSCLWVSCLRCWKAD